MTQPEKLLGSDIWQQERPLQRQSKEIAMIIEWDRPRREKQSGRFWINLTRTSKRCNDSNARDHVRNVDQDRTPEGKSPRATPERGGDSITGLA